MKKNQSIALAIMCAFFVFMYGCDNSVVSPVGPEFSAEDAALAAKPKRGPSAKVEICHETGNGSYRFIVVNENALPAHLGHGDILPGSGGLDGSCRQAEVPPPPPISLSCPCFDAADLAALDITYGGAALQVVSNDTALSTSAYGFFGSAFSFRLAYAGQITEGSPFTCKLIDDTVPLFLERVDLDQGEAEACRQLIREAWPEIF